MQISIALRGYSGLVNSLGLSTTKILTLNLYSVTINQINGLVQRDIIYKNDSCLNWDLGTLRTL